MRLHLDPLDLAPQFQTRKGTGADQAISTRDVTFATLNAAAQAAVRTVGRATYYAWDAQTYTAIYPPNEEA